jgi:hypothetical protein
MNFFFGDRQNFDLFPSTHFKSKTYYLELDNGFLSLFLLVTLPEFFIDIKV